VNDNSFFPSAFSVLLLSLGGLLNGGQLTFFFLGPFRGEVPLVQWRFFVRSGLVPAGLLYRDVFPRNKGPVGLMRSPLVGLLLRSSQVDIVPFRNISDIRIAIDPEASFFLSLHCNHVTNSSFSFFCFLPSFFVLREMFLLK